MERRIRSTVHMQTLSLNERIMRNVGSVADGELWDQCMVHYAQILNGTRRSVIWRVLKLTSVCSDGYLSAEAARINGNRWRLLLYQFDSCAELSPSFMTARLALSPVHTSNNVEATFDFVAKNGNNVEQVYRKISSFRLYSICFDFVERIVRLVAFDNVASTLLLVWTGL